MSAPYLAPDLLAGLAKIAAGHTGPGMAPYLTEAGDRALTEERAR